METLNNNVKIKRRFSKIKQRFNKIKRLINSAKRPLFVIVCLTVFSARCIFSLISCDKTNGYARKGNRKYNKKNYTEAANNYKQALKADSTFSPANYNMGNALMQDSGKDYAQAVNYYNKYLEKNNPKSSKDAKNISKALYNRGNALFGLSQENKESEEGMKYLQQAAQDYKQAMMLNPKDTNAKYNYALCMWLMKNNNNPDNNNDNNQNNSNSEINQMMNAIKNNEKQTISRVKKQKENTQNKKNEKDW